MIRSKFKTSSGCIAIPTSRAVTVVSLTPGARPVINGDSARFYDRDGAPVLDVCGLVTAE
jgi:hypothetical protein